MQKAEYKPYSKLKIARKYISYYLRSGKNTGDSNAVIREFYDRILPACKKIKHKDLERERTRLLQSKQSIDFIDYGKGGTQFKKRVADIARGSLKPKKYARLLAATCSHRYPDQVLEMGTSLGITTGYLARHTNTKVTTLEGDQAVASIANNIWGHLGIENVECLVGDFEKNIDKAAENQYDIVYIDGNHKKEPTLRYFENLLKKATDDTVFIFDDIHYSKSMEDAWAVIQQHPRVSSTIDVFFLGFVYLQSDTRKLNIEIRY